MRAQVKMADKGFQLTEDSLRQAIEKALQSQGPLLHQQWLAAAGDATRRDLEQVRAALASLQAEVGQAAQGLRSADARSLGIHQRLEAIEGDVRSLASDVKALRDEVGLAMEALADSLPASDARSTVAMRELEQSVKGLLWLVHERLAPPGASADNLQRPLAPGPAMAASAGPLEPTADLPDMPDTVPDPDVDDAGVRADVSPMGRARGWLDRHGRVVLIGTGILAVLAAAYLIGLAGKPATPPAPAAASSAASAQAKPQGTDGVKAQADKSAPAPAAAVPKPAEPAPSKPGATPRRTAQDAYVNDLVNALFSAAPPDRHDRLTQAFKAAGIELAVPGTAERVPVTMRQLDALASEAAASAVAGFMLQAVVVKAGQPLAKIDGKVGPKTLGTLSSLKCVADAPGLAKDADGLLSNPGDQWLAVVKACAKP